MKATRFVFLFAALYACAGFAGAQKLLTKDTFFEMESVSGASISSDGKWVLFQRQWIDKIKDQSASNLWLTDPSGQRVRQLTEGSWRDSGAIWSPDGSKVAFLSDRDGTTQLYVMYMDTREVAKLTNLERAPSNIAWSPNGKQIAFTQFEADKGPILPIKLPERPAGAQWAKGATLVNRLNWASDGTGPTQPGTTQVYVVDAVLGGTPQKVTEPPMSYSAPSWSDDSRVLFAAAVKVPDSQYERSAGEIYAIDLRDKKVSQLTDRNGPDSNPQVAPSGLRIAYTGYDEKGFTSHLSSLYLMDVDGGNKKTLATGLASSPTNVTWSPDGKGVHFLVGVQGSTNLYYVDLGGKMQRLTSEVQQLSSFDIAKNGTAVCVRSTFTQPSHVVAFNVKKPAEMKTLVDVNADVLDGVSLSNAEEVWVTSSDGLKVQGWLVKPANFQEGKKYPLVLWIHGGP